MELFLVTRLDQWYPNRSTMLMLLDNIPTNEANRIKQNLQEQDIPNCAKESAIGWLLVLHRIILPNHLNLTAISRTNTGKPYLNRFPFNLSHDYPTVALLVDSNNPTNQVGIDLVTIELNYSLDDYRSIFDPIEWGYITTNRDFFDILWSLKESYIKATGEGLSIKGGLNSIVFHFHTTVVMNNTWISPSYVTYLGKPMINVHFYTIKYCLNNVCSIISLCSNSPVTTLRITTMEVTRFIDHMIG